MFTAEMHYPTRPTGVCLVIASAAALGILLGILLGYVLARYLRRKGRWETIEPVPKERDTSAS